MEREACVQALESVHAVDVLDCLDSAGRLDHGHAFACSDGVFQLPSHLHIKLTDGIQKT